MTILIYTALLVTIALSVAWYIHRSLKNVDIVVMTLFGKTFTFYPISKPDFDVISAPYIRFVNEFLRSFADSTEHAIRFKSEDIDFNNATANALQALRGLDYEKVRLRLRTISNLNPVVNLKTEEGIIQFTCLLPSGVRREIKLRTIFAAKGEEVILEKLSVKDLD